ncbi:antigen p97 (melanoma associated) [Schistosoma haematobium]|uniref:Antigen p97 (Melanoma associated) n=1 Tax=Schistosoma haematobium TaxID=6185 RepID=A0A922ILU5_SCHHA|nr:antigen p97 (melanoma associated) [Schistosoma haematobium]KAH9582369.1 antigen p97 (melanoma associated) [Schistosoma haematobium]
MLQFACVFHVFLGISLIHSQTTVRWCSVSPEEEIKCNRLSSVIKSTTAISNKYNLTCILGSDEFNCMKLINEKQADLMNLDVGLAYYGSSLYSLRPIAVENYAISNAPNARNLYYYAVMVKPISISIDPTNLRGKEICSAGAGTAEGWVMPVGTLISDLRAIPVTQCNSVVQNLIRYLGDSCIPNSLSEIFNPFGDNTQEVCRLCYNTGLSDWCGSLDRYSGNQGALRCLREHTENFESKYKPVVAFLRDQEVELASGDGFPKENYELLCPSKMPNGMWTANISSSANCNWGKIPSRMIMTSLIQNDVTVYTDFLELLVQNFGPSGTSVSSFNLFSSAGYTTVSGNNATHHLMFSDHTKNIYIPPVTETETYYRWIDPSFKKALEKLDSCPLPTLGWCVIDEFEMSKCQRMSSAFSAKRIQPEMFCLQANSTIDCMKLIKDGYADMVTLEAGDLYIAGKYFDLVPVVSENYGNGPFYYAVAIVEKVNPGLLISNWRHRRTCHSGVGKAAGWIIPLNTVLDTRQVIVLDGHLVHAFGELISRGCIPGILNKAYDRTGTNSLNLCELCTGGNADRCRRNNLELYYGDAGAFRCLIEGADIAFARHTTVHTNTGGRNPNFWARDLREDNYEILCPDGRRAEVHDWITCNLGKISSNVVVTANYKSENERTNMWRLLQYGQEYYSSDSDPVFQMFNSEFGQKDLIFNDDTESLSLIPWENQTYEAWLGQQFIQMVENLQVISNRYENGLYNSGILKIDQSISHYTIKWILTMIICVYYCLICL